MQMENINQRFSFPPNSDVLGKATSHVTLITSRSVFRCLMQLASVLLSLVAAVEDIGSIMVDSLSKAEGLD